jgi:AcrR family transcriptional regulator
MSPADAEPPGRPTPCRPLRRDAERNRQKILSAAAEVIAERGLDATLDDVARQAGVGVGTVYRRFRGKEALAEALFDERLGTLAAIAEHALADPDPWAGLVHYLEQAAELLTGDLGLRQILTSATLRHGQASHARARMEPVVTRLVERAQAAGAVRADLRATDIPLTLFMIAAVADYTRPVRPATWRRYLALFLDSLPAGRAAPTTLPEPALSPAEMEQALRSGPGRQRPGPVAWSASERDTGRRGIEPVPD